MNNKKNQCSCGEQKKRSSQQCINCRRSTFTPVATTQCLQCFNDTTNPKFCGRSCAAIWNNTRNPKRKPQSKCYSCNGPARYKSKYCKTCLSKLPPPILKRSLGEIQGLAKYQISAQIRSNARSIMKKSGILYACRICGYSTHVEVSHKKAINSYGPEALISEINNLSNLEYLCRNHHWEHEHGYL